MVQGVFAQKIEIKGTIRNATDNEATEFVNVVPVSYTHLTLPTKA